jgi:hypothetical protein
MYSVGGKIVSVGNKFPENQVKTLTFESRGEYFPLKTYDFTSDIGYFELQSNTPNSVLINWGDGISLNYPFTQIGFEKYNCTFKPEGDTSGENVGNYYYQDNNTGPRKITMTFENQISVTEINAYFIMLINSFPKEISFFYNVNQIKLQSTKYLTSFPKKISKTLTILNLQNAFSIRFEKIPDGFFESKLENLFISECYDLSDVISSNFFKINQLKNTLRVLYCQSNLLIELPNSFSECINLTKVFLFSNNFLEVPKELETLYKLQVLELFGINNYSLLNANLIDHYEHTSLRKLALGFPNLLFSEIPEKWKRLFSLTTIFRFEKMVISNSRFDEFIGYFYSLCTVNGSITEGSSAEPFPNRFRDISWGHSSLSQTGNIQAPSGFSQGISNGTPANQGEKIYVLVNNYGHIITTS